jgi:23S rRNA (pseudouridine1915-N3)-methyltransferase
MRIRLLAVGNKLPSWVEEGFNEYLKRFTTSCYLELIEIPAEKRGKQAHPRLKQTGVSSTQQLIDREGEKLLAAIKPSNRIIALDVNGQLWSTEELASQVKKWQNDGRNIDILIGGPDGLSSACLKKAETKWSLSPLTFPHPLVRIVVAEQLYRAISILNNHPYHRN